MALFVTDNEPGVPSTDEAGGAIDDLRDRVVARVGTGGGATDLRRAVLAVFLVVVVVVVVVVTAAGVAVGVEVGGGAGGACERTSVSL